PVAERRRRPGSYPAGVFPLSLRRQPELPIPGEIARPVALLRQLLAERLRLEVVDVVDREVIALAAGFGQLARELPPPPFPLSRCHLVLAGPEAPRQPPLHRAFVWPPLRLCGRASHREPPCWAPAQFHSRDFLLGASPGPGERALGECCRHGEKNQDEQ